MARIVAVTLETFETEEAAGLANSVCAGGDPISHHARAAGHVRRGRTPDQAAGIGVERPGAEAVSGGAGAAELIWWAVVVELADVREGRRHQLRRWAESWPGLGARHAHGAIETLGEVVAGGFGDPARVADGAGAAPDGQAAVREAAVADWTGRRETGENLRQAELAGRTPHTVAGLRPGVRPVHAFCSAAVRIYLAVLAIGTLAIAMGWTCEMMRITCQ